PNGPRWNGGMKGRKGSTDEGGVRVPFLIRWPGHIQPGTEIPQIAGAIDLLPTLADIAEIPVVSEKTLDGKTIKPLLLGTAEDWPDRQIFTHQRGKVSVRTQQHRLDNDGHLFDLTTDPGQHQDISANHPDLTAELSDALATWYEEADNEAPERNRPFPVSPSKTTPLPARDGTPSGNAQRSAQAPNCSYFTNWTSPDDRLTWNIQVTQSGDYEAIIYYTCPEADLGSTVELSFGENQVQAQVTEAFDPPLIGAEQDRFSRGSESLVKDFRPLTLKSIHLEEGRGDLVLKALDVPGKHVMDVRAVMLTLK
ncbi:MAG: sulfatase-like hydrolase/transferase, partial [bacterium]|nr:sulfatase-like hydrolase/transferase [bacterium]